jgi:hypothetical protein
MLSLHVLRFHQRMFITPAALAADARKSIRETDNPLT